MLYGYCPGNLPHNKNPEVLQFLTGYGGAVEREPERAEEGEVELGLGIYVFCCRYFYCCAMFCVFFCFGVSCFRGSCLRVCVFNNICLTGDQVEREEVEGLEAESNGIGFKGKEGIGLVAVVQAVVMVRIIICGLLVGLVYDQFAPLFVQLFIVVLSIFNGIFGRLIGYTTAPITGADTTNNNEFIGINAKAPPIGVTATNDKCCSITSTNSTSNNNKRY